MFSVMRMVSLLTIGFNLEGIVCSILFPGVPYVLVTLTCLNLVLTVMSEAVKNRMLVEKHEKKSLIVFLMWVLYSLYYTILGTAVMIYFMEMHRKQISLSPALKLFVIYPPGVAIGKVEWINLTFYFGNILSCGLYTYCYYCMFWVNQMRHIYRYLRTRVKLLNEALLSQLPLIPLDSELRGSQCSLCLEEYVESDQIAKLPCSHIFHRNCVRIWVSHSNICPLCRRRVIF